MNLPEYEYKGLMAQAWDVLRGDTSNWPDRFFYLEIIKKYGQPVLDIGCGTGRLLLDYFKQGIDIDGVDNSPEMLKLCETKVQQLNDKPKLFEQYMEALDLPRKYRTILIPSSSIQLIIEPDDVQKALKGVFNHLGPGGAVAASFMTMWKEGWPLEHEKEYTAIRETDGARFRRVSKSQFDPISECISTKDDYQMIINEKVVAEELHHRSPATRSYTQDQARSIFEKAGFCDVTLYSEFTFELAKPSDRIFVVVAQKKIEH